MRLIVAVALAASAAASPSIPYSTLSILKLRKEAASIDGSLAFRQVTQSAVVVVRRVFLLDLP